MLGNSVTANVFMVGVAYQAGLIPLPGEAIERAIELNGTAVEANLSAFRWGRRWTVDPAEVEKVAGASIAYELQPFTIGGLDDDELRHLAERRAGDLGAYQNRGYAARYAGVVLKAYKAEQAAGGDGSFTTMVAHQLHHVMAYKDEYEVARLLLGGRAKVAAQYGDDAKMTWNLYPPMLRSMGLGRKLRSVHGRLRAVDVVEDEGAPWNAARPVRVTQGSPDRALDGEGLHRARRRGFRSC